MAEAVNELWTVYVCSVLIGWCAMGVLLWWDHERGEPMEWWNVWTCIWLPVVPILQWAPPVMVAFFLWKGRI